MNKLRAALILDNLVLKEWQKLALSEATVLLDIKLVLNCTNTATEKTAVKHLLVHSLKKVALKNSFTKATKYKVSDEKVLNFDALYKDKNQFIPKELVTQLNDEQIDVVIKFGMPLLSIDERLEEIPVLAYHYGDPSKFQGKPVGFYELLYNVDKFGLMVERLTDKSNQRKVLAFAESKLVHYSYKKSAENFYRQSQFLLRKALVNFKEDRTISVDANGKTYGLPNNFIAFQFFVILLVRKVRHLGYGAFFEKKWKVGTVAFVPNLRGDNILDLSSIDEFPIDSEYSFYADPFFSLDGSKVRLEGLSSKSGLGDILEFDLENKVDGKQLLTGAHYSYPFSFLWEGQEQLLPEVASHSPQYFFSLEGDEQEQFVLKGLEQKRLADATLLQHEGWWYLFFGDNQNSHSLLNLWVSDSMQGEFKEHPSSPVCLSPSSARMAGRILTTEEGVFRFGQNNNRAYGAAITISEITELSPETYEERVCGSIKINDCLGPHSIDFIKDKGIALIDYYSDGFSLFAGVRRFKALLSKN